MKKVKVKKNAKKTLTADWHKEIQTHFIDVIKHQLVDSELLTRQSCRRVDKPKETYCTGSTYEGQWGYVGFAGHGTYVYPHGATYQGGFWNGQFNGNGTITYPNGQQFIGIWQNGRIVEHSYKYEDGLMHEKQFDYCQHPDRRFHIEKNSKLKAPDKELMTNNTTKKMPQNCYDTVDGYFNPKTKIVYGYDNHVMRVVTPEEEKLITDQYRQETDKPRTFIEGMYKYWTSGRRTEIAELVESVQKGVKPEESTSESSTQNSISIYSFHMGRKN